MKKTITAVLLVGVACVLAHLYVVAQTYYPVVRIESPEGLVFTAVHDATGERALCAAANDRFLSPFRTLCKDCRVVTARCERELQGVEAALHEGKSIPHHRVFAPGLRVAIAGPAEEAGRSCDLIARGGLGHAVRCVPPARPTKS